MKSKNKSISFCFFIFLLLSCSNPTNNTSQRSSATASAYEIMEVVFEGVNDREEIKPLLEKVMSYHDMDISEENLMKCADILVALRKSSVVGVTEMDVLKNMYQHGTKGLDFGSQAAVSFSVLEMNK